MEILGIARALHVLSVVLWIGGVAMVTTVLLPAAQRLKTPEERGAFFEEIEHGFAAQARVTTLVAGVSGFYMMHRMNLWPRFEQPEYWWMHAMVAVWAVFTLMLFVIEPLFLRRRADEHAPLATEAAFRRMVIFHWIMLVVSLVTVAGAVAGSHGYRLFS